MQLTSMHANNTGAPDWSPDGKNIIFASDREGQFELYLVSASGGRPRRLTTLPSFEHDPTFSRDGKWIYFCSDRSGSYQIWKMPAAGGDAVQLTRNGGWAALEAADGASIYYTQWTEITNGTLWQVSTSGGEAVKVLEGIVWWAFAVTRGVYYAEQTAEETRLQFFDLTTRRSTTVAHDLGDVRYVMATSPDGRALYYARLDSSVDDLMLVENFR